MAIITGFSNFTCIPTILLNIIWRRNFEFYISVFTMIASFMYHFTESLNIEIYMEPGKWHILDNIGSICCINMLLISFMNSKSEEKRMKLNIISLLFIIVLQTENPWDLFNTILPIVCFGCLLIYDYLTNGVPNFNLKDLARALSLLVVALAMFVKGLDEHSDYLRIAHSFWHFLMGIGSFYLYQMNENSNIEFSNILQEYNAFIKSNDEKKSKI